MSRDTRLGTKALDFLCWSWIEMNARCNSVRVVWYDSKGVDIFAWLSKQLFSIAVKHRKFLTGPPNIRHAKTRIPIHETNCDKGKEKKQHRVNRIAPKAQSKPSAKLQPERRKRIIGQSVIPHAPSRSTNEIVTIARATVRGVVWSLCELAGLAIPAKLELKGSKTLINVGKSRKARTWPRIPRTYTHAHTHTHARVRK